MVVINRIGLSNVGTRITLTDCNDNTISSTGFVESTQIENYTIINTYESLDENYKIKQLYKQEHLAEIRTGWNNPLKIGDTKKVINKIISRPRSKLHKNKLRIETLN